MKEKLTIGIIGGDRRFSIISRLLARDYKICTALCKSEYETSLDAALGCDTVILPLPAVKDGAHINVSDDYLDENGISASQLPTLYELLMKLKSGQHLLGGMLPGWFIRRCGENGITASDYFGDERLEIMNLIPTVEGCIELMIRESDITVFGSKVLITGYGKIGKTLAGSLRALGAQVCVAARKKSDFAWAQINGLKTVEYADLKDCIGNFDFIVNTVPSQVLGEAELENVKKSCLLTDLASRPGGMDFAAAKLLGLKAVHALSLPGKTSPVSAAEYIYEAIIGILNQKES